MRRQNASVYCGDPAVDSIIESLRERERPCSSWFVVLAGAIEAGACPDEGVAREGGLPRERSENKETKSRDAPVNCHGRPFVALIRYRTSAGRVVPLEGDPT